MDKYSVYNCSIIELDKHHSDRRGNLTVVQNRETIIEEFPKLGLTITILILLSMLSGILLSWLMQLTRKEQRTIVIEIGMQNAAQAITIASSPFVFNNDIMAIPAIVYALMMNVILLSYVGVLKGS